ncbi:MAG: hypothetical protein JOZ69_16850 [Myxococcales bacterium]|nr:hypothetical protein [Myxococcales bacterium]
MFSAFPPSLAVGIPVAVLILLAATAIAGRRIRRRRGAAAAVPSSPYRTPPSIDPSEARAPPGVLAGALTCVVFASVALPLILSEMSALRFDGIALSLLPALLCLASTWCAGCLLLARRSHALDVCRAVVLLTHASIVMLIGLAVLHVVGARRGWGGQAAPPYLRLAIVLALATAPPALVLRWVAARIKRTPREPQSP